MLLPGLLRMLTYHPSGTNEAKVYDGDHFEPHNIERQIGQSGPKVKLMNTLLREQGLGGVCLDRFISASGLKRIRQTTDGTLLVVAAVDNDATRKMCIEVLLDEPGDFLFVTPGNSGADDKDAAIKGNVLWFGRVGDKEFGIRPDILFPNIDTPTDGIPRKGGCTDDAVSSPQLIPANALAAAYTLTVVQNFLDDTMPQQASHMFYNGRTFSTTAN